MLRRRPRLRSRSHRTVIAAGSFAATDGAIDPPRNVRAYSLAMMAAGVELRERTAFTGLRTVPVSDGASTRVVAVETEASVIETDRVLLTGGPNLRAVGRAAGVRIPSRAASRTRSPCWSRTPPSPADRCRWSSTSAPGCTGASRKAACSSAGATPTRSPGEATSIDWPFYESMRARLGDLVPVTRDLGLRKIWAATIDYTPDHQPIVGPALDIGGVPIEGVSVASPGGHG